MSSAVAVRANVRLGRPPVDTRSPAETRELLLSAGLAVFAERGYDGASIKAIAERAGLTSGTIYCHFANKADLLIEVIKQEVCSPLLSDFEVGHGGDEPVTVEGLARLIARYASHELARVRRLSLELHAASAKEAAVAELHAAFNHSSHAGLSALLDAGKARGILPAELAVSHTAHLFHTLILGLSHLETLEASLIGDPDWTRFLEETMVKILCCTPSNHGSLDYGSSGNRR
jgi:AcrR family transcriptional regulator